jgi:DNA-binding transcriptional ArsR family regulator
MARVLGWMLICSPPQQSSGELARALGVSRASISIATRLLEASNLVRRVGRPGSRGHIYELDLQIFTGQLNAANAFGAMRRVMERGIELIGGESKPQADRLREARDFYAFVEHAVPEVIERYRAARGQEKETGR